MINPVQITKTIVAAISFLGELAAVMRANNVPLKKEGRVSAGKGGVTQGATVWECDRNTQARYMLAKQGKPLNASTVADMEKAIANADSAAKAGYALEKAFSVRVDDLHKHFLSLEKGAGKSKGGEVEKAKTDAKAADQAESGKDAKAKAKAEMKEAIRQTEEQLAAKAA